ncbi:hypothetical protein Syun_004456 [Stephania yunnanensis]|uniref:Uncharacterized protein n=1 Tax=Stephania yunnanensis TaxID=152371 RepID=A0AAP0Q2J6_9MAGN
MASTMLRSGIQAAIRRGGRTAQPRPSPSPKGTSLPPLTTTNMRPRNGKR